MSRDLKEEEGGERLANKWRKNILAESRLC